MADEVDIANDLVDRITQAAVTAAGLTSIPVNDTGKCWNCGEAVSDGRRWCSADCRTDWELENGNK